MYVCFVVAGRVAAVVALFPDIFASSILHRRGWHRHHTRERIKSHPMMHRNRRAASQSVGSRRVPLARHTATKKRFDKHSTARTHTFYTPNLTRRRAFVSVRLKICYSHRPNISTKLEQRQPHWLGSRTDLCDMRWMATTDDAADAAVAVAVGAISQDVWWRFHARIFTHTHTHTLIDVFIKDICNAQCIQFTRCDCHTM